MDKAFLDYLYGEKHRLLDIILTKKDRDTFDSEHSARMHDQEVDFLNKHYNSIEGIIDVYIALANQ